jgi:hypothetical protein
MLRLLYPSAIEEFGRHINDTTPQKLSDTLAQAINSRGACDSSIEKV